MPLSLAAADRINRVVDMLDRYVARNRELVLELEQQSRLAAALTGYEQMRAASNAKVAQAKIAMYEPEIELLRNQLERWAEDANIRFPAESPLPSAPLDPVDVTDVDLAGASRVGGAESPPPEPGKSKAGQDPDLAQ